MTQMPGRFDFSSMTDEELQSIENDVIRILAQRAAAAEKARTRFSDDTKNGSDDLQALYDKHQSQHTKNTDKV